MVLTTPDAHTAIVGSAGHCLIGVDCPTEAAAPPPSHVNKDNVYLVKELLPVPPPQPAPQIPANETKHEGTIVTYTLARFQERPPNNRLEFDADMQRVPTVPAQPQAQEKELDLEPTAPKATTQAAAAPAPQAAQDAPPPAVAEAQPPAPTASPTAPQAVPTGPQASPPTPPANALTPMAAPLATTGPAEHEDQHVRIVSLTVSAIVVSCFSFWLTIDPKNFSLPLPSHSHSRMMLFRPRGRQTESPLSKERRAIGRAHV